MSNVIARRPGMTFEQCERAIGILTSSIKMPVLGHLPNSLKSQIVRRSCFPICPSVSKLPAHAKNTSVSFTPTLPYFVFPVYRMMCNASTFSVFGQPPFFVMCEGSHILKKGNPQHLRKRETPIFLIRSFLNFLN